MVLYTEIGVNIMELNPRKLAQLAVRSVRSGAGRKGKDGITYLGGVKKNGVKTPLMPQYEREILRFTDADTLEQARGLLVTQKP